MSESPTESVSLDISALVQPVKARKGAAKRRPHLVTGQALREDDDAVLGHPSAHAAHAVNAPIVVTGHALRP